MAVTTLNSLITYLEGYKDEIEDLKMVDVVFSWEDIIKIQLNSAEYPLLVVEVLDIDIKDTGGTELDYEVAFAVVKKVAADEKKADKWNAMDAMLELTKEVKEKLFCDSEEDEEGFDATLDTSFSPIYGTTASNLFGWRGYGKIKVYR